MKSVYLFGISIAIGLVIVYLQWQQNKKLEEMKQMLLNVPATPADNSFILEQNEKLHAKIESAYDKVHQQYEQILIAVDNMYDNDESMEGESMPSYHVEQLINIDRDFNLSNENLEHIMESQHQDTHNNLSSVKTPFSESSQKLENTSLIKENPPVAAVDDNLISTQSNITANGGLYPKIAELKNLCREKGLTVSGNKNELVQRLLDFGHNFEN
jgi:hypothetical protein